MKHSILSPLRQGFALALTLVGLWILSLTAEFPPLRDSLSLAVNHPAFLTATFPLPQASSQSQSPLVSTVLGRFSFLAGTSLREEPSPEETADPVPVIPPVPQPVPVEVQTEAIPQEGESGNWVEHTFVPNDSHLHHQGIYVVNNGKVAVTEETMEAFSSSTLVEGDAPQILIYHSHGTESYTQTPGATYQESDPYRTLESQYNITEVGRAMATVFEEAGFSVIHDTSLHDYPDYNQSYSNSSAMLADYIQAYPSLVLILDVHRPSQPHHIKHESKP